MVDRRYSIYNLRIRDDHGGAGDARPASTAARPASTAEGELCPPVTKDLPHLERVGVGVPIRVGAVPMGTGVSNESGVELGGDVSSGASPSPIGVASAHPATITKTSKMLHRIVILRGQGIVASGE